MVKHIEGLRRHAPLHTIPRQAGQFSRIGEKVVQHQARKYGSKTKFGLDRFVNGYLDLATLRFTGRFGKKQCTSSASSVASCSSLVRRRHSYWAQLSSTPLPPTHASHPRHRLPILLHIPGDDDIGLPTLPRRLRGRARGAQFTPAQRLRNRSPNRYPRHRNSFSVKPRRLHSALVAALALAAAACNAVGMPRQPQLPPTGRELCDSATGDAISSTSSKCTASAHRPTRSLVAGGSSNQSALPPHARLANIHHMVLPLHTGGYRRPAFNDTVAFTYESIPFFASEGAEPCTNTA